MKLFSELLNRFQFHVERLLEYFVILTPAYLIARGRKAKKLLLKSPLHEVGRGFRGGDDNFQTATNTLINNDLRR
jgi:hypothetical protein